MLDPHAFQRLGFGKCFPTPDAAVTLDDSVAVLKMAETLGFALTAMTIQLAFPGRMNYCQVCI